MLEERLYPGAAFDEEDGLWVISGGILTEQERFSKTVEQTRDGITFEPFPVQLPKTLGWHCFVSLGKGDFFLAGGIEVCITRQCVAFLTCLTK